MCYWGAGGHLHVSDWPCLCVMLVCSLRIVFVLCYVVYIYIYIYIHLSLYTYVYIYIYIHPYSQFASRDSRPSGPNPWGSYSTTVSLHNFKSQNFKSSVSNPNNKYVAYVSVLSQISNCQGLGRKSKHEILKTDRTHQKKGYGNTYFTELVEGVCVVSYGYTVTY